MRRWNPLRRGSVAEPVRSRSRKPRNAQTASRNRGLRIEQFESRMLLSVVPLQLIGVINPNAPTTPYKPTDLPVLNVAPTQLTFQFTLGQSIDPTTLQGIEITRAGADGVFGTSDDVVIHPGYVGIGALSNEVVVRFAGDLPSDSYRVTFAGAAFNGPDSLPVSPLKNTAGDPYGDVLGNGVGSNGTWNFTLALAPQVVAVVPQPVTESGGTVSQTGTRNQIEVDFTPGDELQNTNGTLPTGFFELINTNGTETTADDVAITPSSVTYTYNAAQGINRAILTFNSYTDLANFATGSLRLRIGDQYQAITTSTSTTAPSSTTGSSDPSTGDLSSGGAPQSIVLSGSLNPEPYDIQFPGGPDAPGSRDLPTGLDLDGNSATVPTTPATGTITTIYYYFPATYTGYDGVTHPNVITAAQETAVRGIFTLLETYCGVQFAEETSSGDPNAIRIILGDLTPFGATGGQNGLPGYGAADLNGFPTAIQNAAIYSNDSGFFGGPFYQATMADILQCLGVGYNNEAPDLTATATYGNTAPVGGTNPAGSTPADFTFPGDADIVTLQALYRPASLDVDLYKFTIDTAGTFSTETIAQRLTEVTGGTSPSLLNTDLTLFDANNNVIASNDDYFGTDSYIQVHLTAGTYYVGVSASGNSNYNPTVANSGIGGTSEGAYELRLNFMPDPTNELMGINGQALDGDMDGAPGGVYNYWFTSATVADTLFVDKTSAATAGSALGTAADPYNNIGAALSAALSAAQPGDVVRIVGNNTANDDGGQDICVVDTSGNPITGGQLDVHGNLTGTALRNGQTFTVSGEGQTVTFDFDFVNSLGQASPVPAGDVAVPFHVGDSAVTIATAIMNAINSVDTPTTNFPHAQLSGTTVKLTGPVVSFNAGNTPLTNTLQDNVSYEIGYNPATGAALSDGTSLDVPQGVTVVIDAGAVIKLGAANINVGSNAQGVNRSLGVLQVLGTAAESVYFTSYLDKTIGKVDYQGLLLPSAGNWGGLVFRNDQDYDDNNPVLEDSGIFADFVNHADIRYGGGAVTVGSVTQAYSSIYMAEARPTLLFNSISYGADGAMSADPNSFEESEFEGNSLTNPLQLYTADYDRQGPLMWGNVLLNNTTNGIVVRTQDQPGSPVHELTVPASFTDTDIVYVISSNLIIDGNPGGPLVTVATVNSITTTTVTVRANGRLNIDPGILVKLEGSRIEADDGAQLIAEGTPTDPIIFTSLNDNTYGAGGTFDTAANPSTVGAAGDWAGLYIGPSSIASIDNAQIYYGGGQAPIEGGYANFDVIEARQASLRVSNTLFEYNAAGVDGDRNGRGSLEGTSNTSSSPSISATIYVLGAQPVILDNTFVDNTGAVVSIDCNSLNSDIVPDWGRSTGEIDLNNPVDSNPVDDYLGFNDYQDNFGPLVHGNVLSDNGVNGMVVRGGTLTTATVWDDTDIVYVLFDQITVPNFDVFGGIRLQSSPTASLVVKLLGANAGITASGNDLEIPDRIGGTLQIVGTPGYPVIMTSLHDDTVGAGLDLTGHVQTDTDNDGGATAPSPGDWNGNTLNSFSNDRNVAVVNELENATTGDVNGTPGTAQNIGALATTLTGGDENLRLGIEVHGAINTPTDVDCYSFQATAGTQVWINIDQTTFSLDTVLELVDSTGKILAESDNKTAETAAGVLPLVAAGIVAQPLGMSDFSPRDFYSQNPRDAGFSVILPGQAGVSQTYYVRVASNGGTTGVYRLQVRLQETDETAGSEIVGANIFYATDAINLEGLPENSPLITQTSSNGANGTEGAAQSLGNLLATNSGTIDVSGNANNNVAWYSFSVNLQDVVDVTGGTDWPTVFDVDYADGLSRPALTLWVFNSSGTLILTSSTTKWATNASGALLLTNGQAKVVGAGSNIADDQNNGNSTDLAAGSYGVLDPYIGTAFLPEAGQTYYVAVSTPGWTADALSNPLLREEPMESTDRIVQDNITVNNDTGAAINPLSTTQQAGLPATQLTSLNLQPTAFQLGDVTTFVNTSSDLFDFNPTETSTGGNPVTTDITGPGVTLPNNPTDTYGDIAMRDDGELFSIQNLVNGGGVANYVQLNTGTGALVGGQNNLGIVTSDVAGNPAALVTYNPGITFTALAEVDTGSPNSVTPTRFEWAIGSVNGGANGIDASLSQNMLFLLNASGVAQQYPDNIGSPPVAPGVGARLITNIAPVAVLNTSAYGGGTITGLTVGSDGNLYAVDNLGNLYTITFSGGLSATSAGWIQNGAAAPGTGGNWGCIPVNVASPGFNQWALKAGGPTLSLIANVTNGSGNAIPFSGLTAGPPDAGGGAFAAYLFATDTSGNLWCLNTGGQLQTVFSNGSSDTDQSVQSLSLGVGAAGVAFSTLDYNLWHETNTRATDAGHGVGTTYDQTRDAADGYTDSGTSADQGMTSFYFGLEDPRLDTPTSGGVNSNGITNPDQPGSENYEDNTGVYSTYNMPGGAEGQLVSTTSFSLKGYTAADVPTLYFNYFLSTNESTTFNTARAYVSPDGGTTWDLVATNTDWDSLTEQSAVANEGGVHLIDNTSEYTGWRQAVVNLGAFAGDDDILLKFTFDTGNDLQQPDKTYLNGLAPDESPGRGQNNSYEGFYIDDIIVGFAERGQLITNAPAGDTTFNAVPGLQAAQLVQNGYYQLEIREGTPYGTIEGSGPNTGDSITRYIQITDTTTGVSMSMDTNDRQSQSISLVAPEAPGATAEANVATLTSMGTFQISDGTNPAVTFQFVPTGSTATPGDVPVYYSATDIDVSVATDMITAINDNATIVKITGHPFDVTAGPSPVGALNGTDGSGNAVTEVRVDLFGAASVATNSSGVGSKVFGSGEKTSALGDTNVTMTRGQGQVIVADNQIEHSSQYGIVIEPDPNGPVDSAAPLLAGVAPGAGLVPGLSILNNVLAFNTVGGIHISGDPNSAGKPLSAVPFVRLVNNTFYGNDAGDTGIMIDTNAAATLMNNVVANFATGISVDAADWNNGSPTAHVVIGETAYQDNGQNTAGMGGSLGTNPLNIPPTGLLFVDAANGNFYPAEYSPIIDNSLNWLADRPQLTAVRSPLGIPQSPIVAPTTDLYGKTRIDDPNVPNNNGLGQNVFKDRGAIERTDFVGPSSMLVDPNNSNPNTNTFVDLDDEPGVDFDSPSNPAAPPPFFPSTTTYVWLQNNQAPSEFMIHLTDPGNSGIEAATVVSSAVQVSEDGVPLVEGQNYTFLYSPTTDTIELFAAKGFWDLWKDYTITLDHTIQDMAGNPLQADRADGTTTYDIEVDGVNTAPVLGGAINFTGITEDAITNGGQTVASLIAGEITDPDGPGQGIAITGASETNGTWQYALAENPTTWIDIGAVSDLSSLLLRSTDLVRYLPDGNNGSSDSITFRAWDQSGRTAGLQGTMVDTTYNGGVTPFSAAKATSTIAVSSLNDAPVLNGANNFTTITEDQTSNAGNFVSDLIAGQATDVDIPAQPLGIAITGLTATNGKWQYSLDGGGSWADVVAVSNTSALLLRPGDKVRFLPDGMNGSTDTLTFRAWDQTGSTAGLQGTMVDTSQTHLPVPLDQLPTSAATATSTITVTSLNDAPVLTGANNFTPITEDQLTNAGNLVSALIAGYDSDVDIGAVQGIAITGVTAVNGQWQYALAENPTTWINVGAVANTSALLLRAQDLVRYLPDGMNGGTDTITFRAWDQTGSTAGLQGTKVDTSQTHLSVPFDQLPTSAATATSTISVASLNDAPVLTGANNFTTITDVNTTNGGNLVSALVAGQVTDVDIPAQPLGIAINGVTATNGKWQYSLNSGTTWNDVIGVSATSSLLLGPSNYVRYLPDGTNSSTDTITFRAWDGSSGTAGSLMDTSATHVPAPADTLSYSAATATSTIIVTFVNHAPVLNGINNFTTITEDQITNAGNLVSDLISGGQITDVDVGAVQGIAITGSTATSGKWQYSTTAGSSWTDLGAVADTSALLLRPTDKIRYLPDGMNGGSDTINVRAWDQTSGTAGTKVDTSTNGGTTAFSAAWRTSTITVTSLNDAPVLTGANNFTPITEDQLSNTGNLVSNLIASYDTDVDFGAVQGIAITALTATNGKWQYALAENPSTWINVGAVANTSALLLRSVDSVRFLPDGNNGGTDTITFRAWDQTGSTAGLQGTKVDTSQTHLPVPTDQLPTSAATATSTINVANLNDAPVLTGADNFPTLNVAGAAANTGTLVSALIAGYDTDVDTGAVQGIAITGSTATSGKWQYSLDAGATWNDMSTVSNTAALLLRSVDKVRYLPSGASTSTDTLTFRAWDQTGATAGEQGTLVDTSQTHLNAPFDQLPTSAATATSTMVVDTITPAVTINQAATQADPTNTAPVNFTVVFSEQVADFATGDVSLSGTAPGTLVGTVTNPSGDLETYNVAVSGMTGTGTVVAAIAAGKAHDAAGNPNAASTSTDNSVTYDITAPTVTINEAAGQTDPTSNWTVGYTVVFSKPVIGFGNSGVTVGGTSGANTAVVTDSGDHMTYNVVISGMTTSGTIIASVPAGAAYDAAGNPNTASTSTHNTVQFTAPPTGLTITAPTSGTYTAGATVQIQWTANSVGPGSQVALCYDPDTIWNGNEHWIEVNQVAAANGAGAYSWNTTGVAPGTYYIAGYLYSGGKPYYSHLMTSIVIQPATYPIFGITGPTSGTFTAGQTVPITWTAANVPAGSTVSLDYDQDTIWWNGNEHWIEVNQAPAANGAGTYNWDTTGVAPGTYYMAGYLWANGVPYFSHLLTSITIQAAPAVPSFVITSPTSGTFTAGQTVTVQWTASGVAAGASVSLCYDADTTWWNGNETWFEMNQAPAANGAGSYTWNTTGVAPGTYYIAGYLWTNGQPTFCHVMTSITIQAPASQPTFTITSPTSGSIVAGQNVSVQWTASNVAAGASVSLCYDADTTWWNGNETWFEVNQAPAANGAGSYTWNTTGVAPGTYYLAGYLWSNNQPTFYHSTQPITITAAQPLMVDASQPPQGAAALLTDQQLAPIVTEAERQLAASAGVQILTSMAGVKVEVADLAGGLLGEESGKTILIDQNAAGYGWFVDPTPSDNSEFATVLGPYALQAQNGSPAANRVDLLTTVMHEMGHVLGLEHSASLDLMYPTLALGQRHLLSASEALSLAAAANSSEESSIAESSAVDQIFNSNDNGRNWSWL